MIHIPMRPSVSSANATHRSAPQIPGDIRYSAQLIKALMFAAILLPIASRPLAAKVHWKSGLSPIVQQTHEAAVELLMQEGAEASKHVVVEFDGPLTHATREKLQASGIILTEPLGGFAFFADVRRVASQRERLFDVHELIGAERITPEQKRHPLLASPEPPAWIVLPQAENTEATAGAASRVVTYVSFHKGTSSNNAIAAIGSVGGRIRSCLKSMPVFLVELPFDKVSQLANIDQVMFVEPALPALGTANAENRALTGANVVQAAPYDLDGTGVTVMVYDGGTVRDTHFDFGNRVVRMDPDGYGVHATHVAGIIGGSGIQSLNRIQRGMAPAVSILSYSFNSLEPLGIIFVTDPLDLESNVTDAIANGAEIMNASLALNLASSSFLDCSIEGDYTAVSGLIDGIVRGSLGRPFMSVWGAGNERSAARCGTAYGTVPPPHAGKNHIVVGAVNANDDSMTDFSSWGPVDDGRIKPDFVAPGCQVGGDNGVTSVSGFDNTGYVTICGTSMAAPTVTGLSALLIQDFKAQFPDRPLPRNATLKALLAHTAVDLGNAGPDYKFGYGSVRIQPAIDLMRTGKFREDSLTQGGALTRTINVSGGTPELKVTLAWDDYPAVPNVASSLVNDLELIVISPSATRYYPWTLNPAMPANPAIQTQPDHVNNIEHVLVQNPEAGVWTIEVSGYNVPEGPQSFSLVGDGADQSGIAIDFPAGLPSIVNAGEAQEIKVQFLAVGENIVPGSAMLHYRLGGGAFQTLPLTADVGAAYVGVLPAATCEQTIEYYVSVTGTVSGLVQSPFDAPTSFYSAILGASAPVFEESFETDNGWTTSAAGATAGFWQRGVPATRGPLGFGPQYDADGSGQCFVTANSSGPDDVDNGSVILTSPVFDMSGTPSEITFAYYLYTNDQTSGSDRLTAEVSANGMAGPWAEVFRWHYATGSSTETFWLLATITSDMMIAAGVSPSSTTQIRFLATDVGTSSTVEAAIDAVSIAVTQCVTVPCDYSQADINVFVGELLSEFPQAGPDCWLDPNGDGDLDGNDIQGFVDGVLNP